MTTSIGRVLVVLDAAAETRAAISTAVRLAARSKRRLHAIFVEEEDLLNLVGLPVARHIVCDGGDARLSGADVELQWHAAAARARRELVAAAEAQGLECSFEIVRGAAETVLTGVANSDLVIASVRTRPLAGHFRVQSRWLAALETASGVFLLAQQGRLEAGGRVVVLLRERSEASARLLEAAARLSELGGARLTVIAPPGLTAATSFRNWIAEQIAPAHVQPTIEAAPADTAVLDRRILELNCHLLAVDAATTDGHRLAEITERFTCDLLVAR